MKVAVCALSQSLAAPSGLLSWFSQLARFLPVVDPGTEYHFVVSGATREYITGNSGSIADILGWDNSHRGLRVFSEHFLVGPWAKRTGIDVLLMANAGTAPLLLPKPVKLVQGIFGFHHANATDLLPITRYYRQALFDHTIRRADRIIINSEYSRGELTRLAPAALAKTVVVPHGRNEALFHPGPLTQREEDEFSALGIPSPFISFVSQIYPYKNVHVAIEGYCRYVVATGASHHIAVIGKFSSNFGDGEAYREQLKAIARAHGLEERLHFCAGVSAAALRAIYRKADAYIQSSLSETFGRTSLEAMACGCPIIAARAAATPEIVGDAGLYFEGADIQGCTDALTRMLTDAPLRNTCVALGLERAKRYSVNSEARQLAEVFARVAAEKA
jgi:glycosyltransferase involved in cell wall biosynthesis